MERRENVVKDLRTLWNVVDDRFTGIFVVRLILTVGGKNRLEDWGSRGQDRLENLETNPVRRAQYAVPTRERIKRRWPIFVSQFDRGRGLRGNRSERLGVGG